MAVVNNDVDVDIRWTVKDTQNRQVVLRESTYKNHIVGDHTVKDAAIRESVEFYAKQAVVNPRIIVKDKLRHLYYNVAVVRDDSQLIKIKVIKTVVDTDRIPNEVVTWVVSKGDNLREGAIIYEQGDGKVSDK